MLCMNFKPYTHLTESKFEMNEKKGKEKLNFVTCRWTKTSRCTINIQYKYTKGDEHRNCLKEKGEKRTNEEELLVKI